MKKKPPNSPKILKNYQNLKKKENPISKKEFWNKNENKSPRSKFELTYKEEKTKSPKLKSKVLQKEIPNVLD